MSPESAEHSAWRREFEAMSPEKKRMVAERNPAEFAPSQREVFWRALLNEHDSAKRDAREEETLAIARDALAIAKDDLSIARDSARSARVSSRWAMWAAIIAVIAAAIATKDQILALIFSNS